jgi:hypothetical protein
MSDEKHYAVCVRNDGYEESLELRKIYEVLDDDPAAQNGLLRVIDEDEDYLYPANWFVPIQLPNELEEAIAGLSLR